jgi:hypothetical protein
MKRIKNPTYWLITILLVLLYVFANDIALAIPLKETYQLKEIELNKYDEFAKDFDLKIESIYTKQDIFITTEISGYALIQPDQASPNKAIKLVFSSDDKRYEVDASIIDRFNLNSLYRDKGIVGINHGFITRFSPLNMENGIYKLYIYCYENDNIIGFMDTNRYFEKTYRTFKEVKK